MHITPDGTAIVLDEEAMMNEADKRLDGQQKDHKDTDYGMCMAPLCEKARQHSVNNVIRFDGKLTS